MAKDRLSGKLAVILHADIAGSTALVQQDEQLAHERIQDAFRRFSETIEKYQGHILELRGDALLAQFERASDAVTAALSFQADHTYNISRLKDDLRPTIRVGIAMGEVVIADNTVTGAGVVLRDVLSVFSRHDASYILNFPASAQCRLLPSWRLKRTAASVKACPLILAPFCQRIATWAGI